LPPEKTVVLAPSAGRFGDALRFEKKMPGKSLRRGGE
jgi:hypothetical protein